MKSVLFLCQVFHPDNQSTSQLFTQLFERLQQEGFTIRVLCGYPALRFDDGQGEARPPAREVYKGIEIHRFGARFNYKKNLLLRALHYLSYLWGSTRALLRLAPRSDLVLGVTNPPFLPVVLWLLQGLGLYRYQLMLLDLFPEGLVALGQWSARGLPTRLWEACNARAYAAADGVLVLGRDMGTLVQRRYGLDAEQLHDIPHWSAYEAREARAPEATQLWQRLDLGEAFVVQYSGNMGLWHDMETLVRAAAALKDSPQIRFLFIGAGMRRAGAEALAAELGATNITWLPFQPLETLHDSLACCHLALVSQRASLYGVAVPCKIYGILAAGRGVLALVPPGSEVQQLVTEEACGIQLPPHDPEALAQEIRTLAGDRTTVTTWGRNARSAFQEHYTLDAAVERFKRLWQD